MSTALVQVADSRGSRRWLGLLFLLLFGIFYLAQPFDLAFTVLDETNAEDNIRAVEEGNVGRRWGLLTLAAVGAGALAIPRGRKLRVQGALGMITLAFLCWSAASVSWSADPALTLRKLGALACLACGALGLAKLLSLEELTLFAFVSASGLLLLGLGAEVARGTFTPWDHEYRFAGITWPAFTAWTLSLLLLAGVALRTRPAWQRWAIFAIMLLALPLFVLTKTRTSAVALLAAAATYAVLVWPPRRTLHTAAWLGFALCVIFFAIGTFGGQGLETVADVANLGRERESIADLTGRSEVWQELGPYVRARPWLGYGYESFWIPSRLQEFGDTPGWAVADAHNGFINLTLGVGLVGCFLFTLALTLGFLRAAGCWFRCRDESYAFMSAVIVVEIVNILAVATQLSPYLPSFITMVLLVRLGFVENADESAPLS